MPPAEFQKALLKAQAKFSAGTQLRLLSKNKPAAQATPLALTLALTHWQWPDAKSAQALLQQRAMHTLVGAGEHPMEVPFEIRAEAASKEAITSLEVRLPEEMGKVLVVSYRPQQVWFEPSRAGVLVKWRQAERVKTSPARPRGWARPKLAEAGKTPPAPCSFLRASALPVT